MPVRDPLKVLMLASSYPRHADDTASVFLRYLARGLHARGVRVHVLAPAQENHGTSDEGGIRVTRFRYLPRRWRTLAYGSGILPNLRKNPLLWLAVPFFLAAMLAKTLRVAYRIRPCIVHAHWILPQGAVAAVVGRLLRVPVLTTAHGGDAFALHGGLLKPLKRATLRLSATWTANSRATALSASGYDPALPPACIIPMGVDVARFSSGHRAALRDQATNGPIVLFVGRLVEKKGVDDLLRAFGRVAATQPRAQLWIVGDGDRRDLLERSSAEFAAPGRIRFWGRVPNERLPDFYAAADLFVAPSVVAESGDTEGLGVVFLEAFAARVPVVATDVGGIGEIVQHARTGLLVPPRQPDSLASAIERVLADPELGARLAANAYELVREQHDWEMIARGFAEIYERLADAHPAFRRSRRTVL